MPLPLWPLLFFAIPCNLPFFSLSHDLLTPDACKPRPSHCLSTQLPRLCCCACGTTGVCVQCSFGIT